VFGHSKLNGRRLSSIRRLPAAPRKIVPRRCRPRYRRGAWGWVEGKDKKRRPAVVVFLFFFFLSAGDSASPARFFYVFSLLLSARPRRKRYPVRLQWLSRERYRGPLLQGARTQGRCRMVYTGFADSALLGGRIEPDSPPARLWAIRRFAVPSAGVSLHLAAFL